MKKRLIPLEWVCATLAALTIPLSVYLKLPIWATFVTWGGTFLVDTNMRGVRMMFPALILGSVAGVIFFVLAFTIDPIVGSAVIANGAIVFVIALALLYMGRIPAFGLVPGIFFGFACYVGVAIAAQATTIGALFVPWIYAIVALLLGPVLAWLSVTLTFSSEVEPAVDNVVIPTENLSLPS
jgi:hypothetical protein